MDNIINTRYSRFFTEKGKMKKYLTCCPHCNLLSSSYKLLTGFGFECLISNDYVYQKCKRSRCQNHPLTNHEKEILKHPR